jgi:hypothetical protein
MISSTDLYCFLGTYARAGAASHAEAVVDYFSYRSHLGISLKASHGYSVKEAPEPHGKHVEACFPDASGVETAGGLIFAEYILTTALSCDFPTPAIRCFLSWSSIGILTHY